MNASFEIKRISVREINVAFTQIGHGDKYAIVCQGWGTDFTLYESIANALEDDYTIVLFDFPGFGRSPEPKEAWNVSQYCDFFEDFLRALDITRATLIGHSFGGRVIIELENRSEKDLTTDKIVLIDSAGIMPERSSLQKLKAKIFKLKRSFLTSKIVYPLFPEVIDDWISRQGSQDYRAASPIMKQALVKAVNYDQREMLSKIDVPTLLIWGEDDDATPLSDAKIMEREIPDAGLVVFSGCGHYSFLEQSGQFRNVLRSFLC